MNASVNPVPDDEASSSPLSLGGLVSVSAVESADEDVGEPPTLVEPATGEVVDELPALASPSPTTGPHPIRRQSPTAPLAIGVLS